MGIIQNDLEPYWIKLARREFSYTFVAILCHVIVKASIELLINTITNNNIIQNTFDSSSVNFQLQFGERVDLRRVDIVRLRVKLPYMQRGNALCNTIFSTIYAIANRDFEASAHVYVSPHVVTPCSFITRYRELLFRWCKLLSDIVTCNFELTYRAGGSRIFNSLNTIFMLLL